MQSNSRRTRFEGRIDIERHFLSIVNEKFGDRAPLAGMTEDAIESWALRATTLFPHNTISSIKQILIEAAIRSEILADNSRDVFVREEIMNVSSLDELSNILRSALI
jgi:hypothetical protein